MSRLAVMRESRRMSQKIAENIAAKEIYLFGSYAYGVPNKDSDIDLYVVADLSQMRQLETAKLARRSLIGHTKMPVDIIVCDKNTFEIRKKEKTTLEYIVATEGVKLYG